MAKLGFKPFNNGMSGVGKKKQTGELRGVWTIQHSPPEFLDFFSLLETPQNFVITPLGDIKA